MTSEEYVQQVNRLMDLQNTYLQVFLWILGAAISILALIQWRFTSQQLNKLKEKTKQETIKEIENLLGVSNISDLNREIEEVSAKQDSFQYHFLHNSLNELFNEEKAQLWKIVQLLDTNKDHILKSINNFNYVVSRIDGYIVTLNDMRDEKLIDYNSTHIDKIIERLSRYENEFNEKSEELREFKNAIAYRRNTSK